MHEQMVECILQLMREKRDEAEKYAIQAKGHGAQSHWEATRDAYNHCIFMVQRAVEIEKEHSNG